MKLYCTPGGTWAGNEADYKKALKAEGVDPKSVSRKQVEVPVSKAELLEFLTFHGVNPIGGRVSTQVVGGAAPQPPAAPPAAPEKVDLDTAFEAAPLAHQLHLAALACENARSKIK